MVTKKVRTEYMKKFRDPKWETFSKSYEDSLKYRLTRRVMEHSHKPWFWEGWDSGSDSSGWSTPRLTRNKVAPLSLPPPQPTTSLEVKQRLSELKTSPEPERLSEERETEVGTGEAPVVDAALPTEVVENDVNEANGGSVKVAPNPSGPSDDTGTDNGLADSASSDGEPLNRAPRTRHCRRTPRSESGQRDSSEDNTQAVFKKSPRAKSQPPISTKKNLRPSSRLDWTEREIESHTSNARGQTRRESDKQSSNLDRRRARSADLEKTRQSQLTVVDDRWMTEYMRCFSARLR
ncbi:centriole, cilia and spindle-associated protein isoform 1-T2 [Odontesthes bonariensis]|uniref:centriole, cilia and spindle-associated protein n=1 Tax=Odontesthes bonariensis TaxID=219752 RepID=UPI003F582261